MKYSDSDKTLLGIVAAAVALFLWACVAFSQIPVSWGRYNPVPMSRQNRIALAVTMTFFVSQYTILIR
jgi:hypothetical protein